MVTFYAPGNHLLQASNTAARAGGLCSCCPRIYPPGISPGTKTAYHCNLSRVDYFSILMNGCRVPPAGGMGVSPIFLSFLAPPLPQGERALGVWGSEN